MDVGYVESHQEMDSFEARLATVEERLGAAEKQAAAVLKAIRRLRRAATEGAVSSLAAGVDAVRSELARIGAPLAEAAELAGGYDTAAAFADGQWLAELAEAAKAAGVVLVQRDGRVTAYPVALRLDARAQGIRIGRRLEKRIRPSFVAAQLKLLQQRPDRFNARQFLDRLFALYESKARAEDPAWRPTTSGPGPLVPLAELYDQLTLLPVAASDYPQEEFVADVLRLDRQPDATTSAGHGFELGGSTGRKGGKRLTLFDETGEQHDYYAIRFILEPSRGRASDDPAAAR
jgi:hypothetical protein